MHAAAREAERAEDARQAAIVERERMRLLLAVPQLHSSAPRHAHAPTAPRSRPPQEKQTLKP